ncbi:hypothetical protein BT69DRAFT_1354777 [Atractiella rhizophila]|nr:hypothetical protein BT69DRAFT_1354777 [Atractiella rhizophila]
MASHTQTRFLSLSPSPAFRTLFPSSSSIERASSAPPSAPHNGTAAKTWINATRDLGMVFNVEEGELTIAEEQELNERLDRVEEVLRSMRSDAASVLEDGTVESKRDDGKALPPSPLQTTPTSQSSHGASLGFKVADQDRDVFQSTGSDHAGAHASAPQAQEQKGFVAHSSATAGGMEGKKGSANQHTRLKLVASMSDGPPLVTYQKHASSASHWRATSAPPFARKMPSVSSFSNVKSISELEEAVRETVADTNERASECFPKNSSAFAVPAPKPTSCSQCPNPFLSTQLLAFSPFKRLETTSTTKDADEFRTKMHFVETGRKKVLSNRSEGPSRTSQMESSGLDTGCLENGCSSFPAIRETPISARVDDQTTALIDELPCSEIQEDVEVQDETISDSVMAGVNFMNFEVMDRGEQGIVEGTSEVGGPDNSLFQGEDRFLDDMVDKQDGQEVDRLASEGATGVLQTLVLGELVGGGVPSGAAKRETRPESRLTLETLHCDSVSGTSGDSEEIALSSTGHRIPKRAFSTSSRSLHPPTIPVPPSPPRKRKATDVFIDEDVDMERSPPLVSRHQTLATMKTPDKPKASTFRTPLKGLQTSSKSRKPPATTSTSRFSTPPAKKIKIESSTSPRRKTIVTTSFKTPVRRGIAAAAPSPAAELVKLEKRLLLLRQAVKYHKANATNGRESDFALRKYRDKWRECAMYFLPLHF